MTSNSGAHLHTGASVQTRANANSQTNSTGRSSTFCKRGCGGGRSGGHSVEQGAIPLQRHGN
jgi:hypothetical protein